MMAAMPKLILTCAILGVLFCTLWGPSLFVALRLHRRGDWAAMRALRVLWPLQLVLAAALVFAADAAGVSNPVGCGVVIVIGVGIAGAAAFAAWRLVLGFVKR